MNAEDFTGPSIATKARRARDEAAEANNGPGAELRLASQRSPRTHPETPLTTSATAVSGPETLANPTNVAYRQRFGLAPTIATFASPMRRPFIPHATTATAVQSNQVYLTRPTPRE